MPLIGEILFSSVPPNNRLFVRVGVLSKLRVSTPKSFTFVLKSTMNIKKWYLKVNNHPLIGFLVL